MKLNIACGTRYHPSWTNIDFTPTSKEVKKVNILAGLPYADDSVDIVYSSHFLEHLSPSQAEFFLKEIQRVLKRDGIVRIVVPDLENLCKEYLEIMKQLPHDESLKEKHDWIVIELLDQMVRVNSGGKMLAFFNKVKASGDQVLSNYILDRIGDNLLNPQSISNEKPQMTDRIHNKIINSYLKVIRLAIPKNLRDSVFINTSIGERHQWMYDTYSLSNLLKSIGFNNVTSQAYDKSQIPNFNTYLLDINADSTPYKGCSSIYLEATK